VLDLGGRSVFTALKRQHAAPPNRKSSLLGSAGSVVLRPSSFQTLPIDEAPTGLHDTIVSPYLSQGSEGAAFQSVILVQDPNGNYPLLVQYLCIDRNDDFWVLGFRLWQFHELASSATKMRPGFNQTYECVRGDKPVYLKVSAANITAIGCCMKTNHIKRFKKCVRDYRVRQVLGEKGLHPDTAVASIQDSLVQQVDLVAPTAYFSCFYYFARVAQKEEDLLWSAHSVLD
jgi:hypothetical protein